MREAVLRGAGNGLAVAMRDVLGETLRSCALVNGRV
jgi:hypothetical protein